jgi:hypothetical protein
MCYREFEKRHSALGQQMHKLDKAWDELLSGKYLVVTGKEAT